MATGVEEFIERAQCCANCGIAFAAADGERSAVAFASGGGLVIYVCCEQCGGRAKREGIKGVPGVAEAARVTPSAQRTLKVTVSA